MTEPQKLSVPVPPNSNPEQQQRVAELLTRVLLEQEEMNRSPADGDVCFFYIPDPVTLAFLAKYTDDRQCPKCGHQLVVGIFHGSIGDVLSLYCRFNTSCDYRLPVPFDASRL